MKKSIIIILFFALSSCVRVQIPVSMQQQINRIEQKVDTNTVSIQKNYKSFIKILQNATNPNNNYKPLSNDELLKLLNSPNIDGKGTKN
jgi:hypothetical protein